MDGGYKSEARDQCSPPTAHLVLNCATLVRPFASQAALCALAMATARAKNDACEGARGREVAVRASSPRAPPAGTHDARKIVLAEAAARQRRRAHADAGRVDRRRVARHRVLVHGQARCLAHALDARAIDARGPQVDEEEVVVRAAGHEREPLGLRRCVWGGGSQGR